MADKNTNDGLIVGVDDPIENDPDLQEALRQQANGRVNDPITSTDPSSAGNASTTPPETSTTANNGNRTFSAEDIAKARQEEKDKLYGRLNTLESEVKKFREAEEAQQRAQQEAQQRAEEESRKKAEEEMSAKELLSQREAEWNKRFTDFEAERERERAVFEQERRYQELQQYIAQRRGAEAENIMPELLDLIGGNTPEEVEASIASLKDRTSRILEQVQQTTQDSRQSMTGTRVSLPPVGPLDNDMSYENVSADALANMDMSEYAKNRERLLGAVRNRVNQSGPYG